MSNAFALLLDRVAEAAISEVSAGMRLGLGTGRAAEAFIRLLGARVRAGLEVVAVPTSERSSALARELGLTVVSLDDVDGLDVAFDGADEVSPTCALTKGRGGAMLRERVVAAEATRFVVLVTEDKLVEKLGEKCPLPVEVVPFALASCMRRLRAVGRPVLRKDSEGQPYRTDNGNRVLDVFPVGVAWQDAAEVDAAVRRMAGVVDTGFFFGMASRVVVGGAEGVSELSPSSP